MSVNREQVLLVTQVLRDLGVPHEQLRQRRQEVAAELRRRLPDIIKIVTLTAVSPFIQARAARCYAQKPVRDSEGLASELTLNILKRLWGGWPRGNVGAWLAKVQRVQFAEHVRRETRARAVMGRCRNVDLEQLPKPAPAAEYLDEIYERLTPQERLAIDLRQMGVRWSEVTGQTQLTRQHMQRVLKRLLDRLRRSHG